MKKTYEKPTIEVETIKIEDNLLNTSGTLQGTYGGFDLPGDIGNVLFPKN